MSEQLVEEGWLAPAHPGPRRVHVVAAVVMGAALLSGWFLLTMTWRADGASGAARTVVELNEFGRAALDGRDLDTEVRRARGVDYLVVPARVSGDHSTDATRTIEVVVPSGVDGERVTLRVVGTTDAVRIRRDELGVPSATVELGGAEEDLRVLVLVPAAMLDLPDDASRPAGPLAEVTGRLDAAARRDATDLQALDRLRDASPWLLPLLLVLAVGAPLALWWRRRRAFFSMRRPGPGKDLDSAPPSSLDPVGAAVLVAGARPVDAAAAFAGHVLDLVERRQLLMRRSMDVVPGAGTLLGLGHADELDDAAVHALRATTLDDGITVAITDSRAKLRRVPEPEQDAWYLHVAARERFESMMDRIDTRRLVGAAALLVAIGVGSLVTGLASDLPGRRALLWLVTATTLPAAVTVGLWARDASAWRIVTRARRTERAQWIAWRAVVGTGDGPALDQRNLPVIAATAATDAGVRAFAGPDAVGLDAVTTRTIDGLKVMIADR